MQDRLPLRISLLLFIVTLLVFYPTVTHGFITFDDRQYISTNRAVQRGVSWEGVVWAFTTFYAANWHPLTWLSHMLDWQLYGDNAQGHHFTTVLLHAANSVGLFLVLRRMTGSLWRPALIAALFSLHPLHVESVAWASERKDVLSTFFGILALGAYTAYSSRPRLGAYLLLFGAFALSLLAKPMLVTLPIVLLLLDYWPLQRYVPTDRGWGWLVLEKVPLLALSAATCVLTMRAQIAGDAIMPVEALPLSDRLVNALVTYLVYLRKMVWPLDLAAFYPYTAGQLLVWQVAACALVLLAITTLAVIMRGRAPALLVGWLWYLGALVPVIGLVQVGGQARADRYTYFPLIGVFLAIAWSIPDRVAERRLVQNGLTVTAILALAACVVATLFQQRYWRNDVALWEHALAVTADNPVAEYNLGVAFLNDGRFDHAEGHFARVVQLIPNYPSALTHLGTCLRCQDRFVEAIGPSRKAVVLDPENDQFHNNLGLALDHAGKLEEAGQEFLRAIRLDPLVAEYHYNLAANWSARKNQEAARQAYHNGLSVDADWPRKAEREARDLLAAKKPKLRCPGEALFRARQAVEATGGKDPEMLSILAEAYAATGQKAQAVKAARKAVEAALARRQTDLAQQLQGQLHRYENDRTVGESNP